MTVSPSLKQICASIAIVTAIVCATQLSSASAADVRWQQDVSKAVQASASSNRPMLLMFEGRNCGPCRKMLRETFGNRNVANRVNARFIPLLIDAQQKPALAQQLQIESVPTVVVINPDQQVVARFTGFQTAKELDSALASYGGSVQPAASQAALLGTRRPVRSGGDVKNPFVDK